MNEPFDAEKAIAELRASGWNNKIGLTVWKSPWGALYHGPAYAYRIMLAVKDNPVCPTVSVR